MRFLRRGVSPSLLKTLAVFAVLAGIEFASPSAAFGQSTGAQVSVTYRYEYIKDYGPYISPRLSRAVDLRGRYTLVSTSTVREEVAYAVIYYNTLTNATNRQQTIYPNAGLWTTSLAAPGLKFYRVEFGIRRYNYVNGRWVYFNSYTVSSQRYNWVG